MEITNLSSIFIELRGNFQFSSFHLLEAPPIRNQLKINKELLQISLEELRGRNFQSSIVCVHHDLVTVCLKKLEWRIDRMCAGDTVRWWIIHQDDFDGEANKDTQRQQARARLLIFTSPFSLRSREQNHSTWLTSLDEKKWKETRPIHISRDGSLLALS